MGEVTSGDTATSAATMASLLGFDLLPVLSESEERVSLAEVLMTRDRGLSDRELWAMCREACHAIVGVCNSAEVFQMLCVTPDTLAFDSSGAVCFVNLSPEPDMLYVPPEYEEVGNSYKGHIFSLGMTMLYAAGYNTVTDNHSLDLSPELEDVITAMTVDEYDDRSSLEDILELCDGQLHGVSSEDICGQLADIEKLDTSLQENQADDSDVASSGENPIPSPNPSDSVGGMDSPTEPLSSSTPSLDDASLTLVTSRDGETSLQDNKEEETITDYQTLPWSVTDDRTLSCVDSHEKLDITDDVETLEGDFDDGCSTVTSATIGLEDGEGDRGDGEDGVDTEKLSGGSEDKLLSAVLKSEMVRDQCAADIPERRIPEDIPRRCTEDIPGKYIPEDISHGTNNDDTHNCNHKDKQETDRDRCMDCKKDSDVSDNHKDGPSLSPSCDSQQDTERNVGEGTEHTFWEKVERKPSGERNISEIAISLKSPPLKPICKVQQNSCSPTETSSETAKLIGPAHGTTTNHEPATTDAAANLLSTAGISHASPHANKRGCRQRCNGPCNVAPESSGGSCYKYVKNGQLSSRAGNSGETKTTVPYLSVFKKKRGATERGADIRVGVSADTGSPRTQNSPLGGRHSDVRGADLAVDTTTAGQEMEFDVLTLRDLKLQAGRGGRVVPLSETPTDNIKNPQVVQIPQPQRVGQIIDPPVRQIIDPPVRQITNHQEAGEIVEQQTVREILEKLGSGLHETELWALCTECVHALQCRGTQALPGYVSLDTVIITDDGHIDFQEVAEVAELELLYLAPELQEDGVITEKTCLFGFAVLLWLAADYKMPTNQEPALSEEFENLLISMTQDNADLRPLTSAVIQVCENYQRSQDMSSTIVCQMLASDARKAKAFGKTNVLVRNILEEALEHEAVSQKAQLMDSIKAAQLQLKPVSDRQLAEKQIKKCLHECLMEDIKHPQVTLRKCRQPRLRSVRALFQSDSRLLRGLARVTSGATDHSSLQNFQPSSGSAFSLVPSQKQGMRKPNEYSSVPSALNSSATHFMPIVLTPTGDVKRREMPKIPVMSDAEREKKVARKLEELKMNVRRNQLPFHLASDVERETPTEVKFVSELKIGKVGEEAGQKQEGGSPRSGSGRLGEGSPRSLPQPSRARQGYDLGQTRGRCDAVTSPVKNGQFCYSDASEGHIMSTCQQKWGSNEAQYQGVFTSPVHQTMSSPSQGRPDSMSPLGQYCQGQGYHPQHMTPQQPFPMATPFPFQVQLQQDPRTGFFQMIPVPMPAMLHAPGMMPAYSMPVIPTPSPPQPTQEHQYQTNNQSKQSQYRPQADTSEGRSHGVKDRIRSTKVHRLRAKKTGETEGEFDKLNDAMERDSSRCLHLEEVGDRREGKQGGSYNYSEEGSNPEMASDRRRRDWKSNLKRAKSGSHIDYQYNEIDIDTDTSPPSTFSRTTYRSSLRLENGLSRSQPNIGGHQMAVYNNGETKLTSQKKLDCVSPDDLCSSPPPSPSWSKDSGVSGVNMKGSADATLMERLLNGDTAKHQKLMRVIQLIRDEFAFDGYMENGIEDLAMGEYILSLGSLKWETFQGAVTEKYCDLYWQDELMTRLYEAVNGHKPVTVADQRGVIRKMRTKQPKTPPAGGTGEPDPMSLLRGGVTRRQRPVSDIHDMVSRPPPVTSLFIRSQRRASDSQEWEDNNQSKASESSSQDPRKPGSYLRSSNTDSGGTGDIHSVNGNRNYERSISMLNIYTSTNERNNRLHSQNAVHRSHGALNGLVESSTDDVDDEAPSGGEMRNIQMPNAAVDSTCDLRNVSTSSNNTRKLGQFKSQSTYFVYPRDSESSSINSARSCRPCNDLDPNGESSNSSIRSSNSSSSNASCLTGGRVLLSARSESHLATGSDTKQSAETARHAGSVQRRLDKGSVVYYHAEMADRARVSDPAYEPDSKTKAGIESKMAELNQQMSIEHRNRRKTQEYYRKLVEATKASSKVSSEHKASMVKVLREMKETTQKLDHFDSCMKHLEMLYAEQWGLEHELLYALANCPGDEPMLLAPYDNILVQYQTLTVSGMGGQVLQAGMSLGLMAYLFAQHALSDGYIHQFFYCYRYFTAPCHLLRFLIDKYTASTESLSPDDCIPVKVKARALDLLQVWLEGYYGVDFRHSPELACSLRTFLKMKVVPVDASAESLLELMELCEEGRQVDLAYPDFHATPGIVPYETRSLDDNQPVKKTSTEFESEAGTEWESFKAAMHLSAKPAKLQQRSKSTRKLSMNSRCEDSYPKRCVCRAESFSLSDHTAQTLAEQLTLMEQELFQLSHPVSYLNSKARGVSVDLADPVIQKTHRVNMAWEDVQGSSLFVHTDCSDNIIQRLIDHAQNIACWVAAEIVSCNSIKLQVNVLSRFIEMARMCRDLRNFAVCVAILNGLENILVRQLPAWRSLPSKSKTVFEDLAAVRIFLKTDAMCLANSSEERSRPTIPCILLFLLHVQQLEIGGFTLANGMYKWTKLKKLCHVVDQIRHFKQIPYHFTPDSELQALLRQRIEELSQQNIHALAAQHDSNVHKISSGGGIQGALRRMRNKFQ